MKRSPKTTRNYNTAWWDASQIYGYDDRFAPPHAARPERSAQSSQMVQAHTGTRGRRVRLSAGVQLPCARA